MRQILKVSDKALRDKYTTDAAAITANIVLTPAEQVAQQAALKLALDQELVLLKGQVTQQKADAKFQMQLKREEFRYKQQEAELNDTQKVTDTLLTILPNATQALIKAEQKKERDVLARLRYDTKVKLYLQKYQGSTANHSAEISQVLNESATQASCNATCVADCVGTQVGFAAQATCLDVCVCFHDSLVKVPPKPVVVAAPAVVAPVTSVTTDLLVVSTPLLTVTTTVPVAEKIVAAASNQTATSSIVAAVQEVVATSTTTTTTTETSTVSV